MRATTNPTGNIPAEQFKELSVLMAKARPAYAKLIKENQKLGIPTPFSLMNRIYFIMPDGKIILKSEMKKIPVRKKHKKAV